MVRMAPFLITWLCLVAIVLGQAPAFYVPVVVGPLDDSSAIETDLSITIDALYMQNKIDHNRIGELIIDRIVLTSDPQQDQQIIGDYLAMHRDVDIAFAVVLTSNPYVPSQFVGIPTLWSFDGGFQTGRIGLASPTSSLFQTLLSMLRRFNWNELSIVYSNAHSSAAGTLKSFLLSNAVNVTGNFLVEKLYTQSYKLVRNALEQLTSRIVVVLAGPRNFVNFATQLKDTPFELVWIDSDSIPGVHTLLDASAFCATCQSAQAIFAIEPDFQDIPSLGGRGDAALQTSTTARTFRLGVQDAVQLYAAALNVTPVGQERFGSVIRSNFLNLSTFPTSLNTGVPIWNDKAERVGLIKIWNFAVNSSHWTEVGSWRGPRDNSSAATGELTMIDASAIMFANGEFGAPPSTNKPSYSVGLIWGDQARYSSWSAAAAIAVKDVNSAGIIPGFELRTIFTADTATSAGTILASVEQVERGVVGIVGGAKSGQAVAMQIFLGSFGIPLISPSASSDSLSDSSLYTTFSRTMPADRHQAAAVVALMRKFNWRCATVIYTADEYGTNMAFKISSEANDTTIDFRRVPLTTSALATLRSTKNFCNIYIAVLDYESYLYWLTSFVSLDIIGYPRYQWIFTEAILSSFTEETLVRANLTSKQLQGTFITTPRLRYDNPIYAHFEQQLLLSGNAMSIYALNTYDAIFLIAHAIGSLVRAGQDPANGPALLASIRAVSFDGASGLVSVNDDGDRDVVAYSYFNYQTSPDGVVQVGYFRDNGVDVVRDFVFNDGTKNPPIDRPPRPVMDLPRVFLSVMDGIAPIVLVSLGLLILVATVILVWVWRFRPLIRKSSPFFLNVTAVGEALVLVGILFLVLPPENNVYYCHLRIWFLVGGLTLSYSALLSKNWRLYHLFNDPSLRVTAMPNSQLLVYLTILVCPALIALVLWSSLEPFSIVAFRTSNGTANLMLCANPNDKIFTPIVIAYFGFLIAVGGVLSFKTRKLPDSFNESWWIALITYNHFFVATICIIVGYTVQYEPKVPIYIACAGLMIASFVQWALIFAPKFYVLLFHREDSLHARKRQIDRINTQSINTDNSISDSSVMMNSTLSKESQEARRRYDRQLAFQEEQRRLKELQAAELKRKKESRRRRRAEKAKADPPLSSKGRGHQSWVVSSANNGTKNSGGSTGGDTPYKSTTDDEIFATSSSTDDGFPPIVEREHTSSEEPMDDHESPSSYDDTRQKRERGTFSSAISDSDSLLDSSTAK